jgi:subtilisin-like proprotein convertase family protein
LAGLTHGYPADLDIMLLGPQGQKVLLVSDVGGSAGIENARFTLDDTAASSLPFNPSVPMTNGTYKPTNYGGSPDDFPDTPAGTVSATLAAFAGTDPNGTWSLYIRDTFAGFGGTLSGGWILNIYTTEPSISDIADQFTDENVPVSVSFQIADADTPITNLVVRAGSESPELFDVALSGTGATRTVVITPVPYAYGEGIATVAVTDGTGIAVARFNVTVRPINQAPEILGLTDQAVPSNRELRAKFMVTDQESAGVDLQVTASLLQPEFGTVAVAGTDTNRWLVFNPAGQQGQTFVSVVASDGVASSTNVISIVVGAPYELVISAIPAQTVAENASVTVGFTVTGSESGNVAVTAVAADPTLIASVVTTGSGSSWNVKITAADDVAGATKVLLVATDEFGTGNAEIDVTVVPANDPPVFGAIPDQSTLENQSVTFDIPISDKDTALTSLVWTWASSNPDLINNVVFGLRTGGIPIATVFPKRDQVGQASVTLFADDGTTKVGAPVLVTVSAPPNVPLVFGPIPDQTTSKNIPLTIELPISDPDTAVVDIVMTGTSLNQSVVRNVLFGIKNGTTITATLRPVSDATGVTRVSITADDGATKVTQSFDLTVTEPTNEPPVFGAIPDQTVQANDRPTITLDIADVDTAISSLILTGVSSNPSLVVGFDFDQTGAKPTVTLLLGQDKTGIAVVTITADDGKSKVSQSFALQVTEASTPELAIPSVTRNPDGTLTVVVTWENGGELEWSLNVTGPWIKTGNTSGRYTEITAQSRKIYRVSR